MSQHRYRVSVVAFAPLLVGLRNVAGSADISYFSASSEEACQ